MKSGLLSLAACALLIATPALAQQQPPDPLHAQRRDRGSGKPAVTAPALKGAMGDYIIIPEDYPPAAWRQDESGDVGVRLTISASGIPSSCKVTRPTGSRGLDITTCILLMRRLRFIPARDANGRRTIGKFSTVIHWELPPGRPPVTYGIK